MSTNSGAYLAVALRARYESYDDPEKAQDEPDGWVLVDVSAGGSEWFDALSLPVQRRYGYESDDDVVANAVRDWLRSRSGAGHAHTIR